MNKIKLLSTQINKMIHMLGLDRKKYSYRNYYCSFDNNEELDELVNLNLATVKKYDDPFNKGLYYHLTDKGINFIKDVLGDFEIK